MHSPLLLNVPVLKIVVCCLSTMTTFSHHSYMYRSCLLGIDCISGRNYQLLCTFTCVLLNFTWTSYLPTCLTSNGNESKNYKLNNQKLLVSSVCVPCQYQLTFWKRTHRLTPQLKMSIYHPPVPSGVRLCRLPEQTLAIWRYLHAVGDLANSIHPGLPRFRNGCTQTAPPVPDAWHIPGNAEDHVKSLCKGCAKYHHSASRPCTQVYR